MTKKFEQEQNRQSRRLHGFETSLNEKERGGTCEGTWWGPEGPTTRTGKMVYVAYK